MGKNQRPPIHKPVHWKSEGQRLATWRRFAAAHKQRDRPSAGARGYDAAWRAVRAAHLLARAQLPHVCRAWQGPPGAMVDHIESIAKRPDFDWMTQPAVALLAVQQREDEQARRRFRAASSLARALRLPPHWGGAKGGT